MFKEKNFLYDIQRKQNYKDRKIDKKSLFLDRNEKFVEFSKPIKKKLIYNLSKINPGLYPNVNFFYKKLSKFLSLPKYEIFLTEGVSGAIKCLIECYTEIGKSEIIYPFPTFAMYPIYSKMFNLKEKRIGYNKDFEIDFNLLLHSISKKTTIVFLPNPNIPIEGFLEKKQLIKIIKKCESTKTILAIDEVYFPFSKYSALKLIKSYDKIFILRSFSKAFGLAGIRLGYIISNKSNISYISKMRTGYETNSYSMEVGSYFIDNYNVISKYIKEVKLGLKIFRQKLKSKNIQFVGGLNSCYIFLNLKNQKIYKMTVNKLKKEKIYVRGGWPEPYNNFILVSGSTLKNFNKFVIKFFKIFDNI